jgi:L-arabinose isomerase
MTNDFLSQSAAKADATLVVAESKSFVAFGHWMDEQLDQLVARWIHTAAPNASRWERRQQRLGRQTHAK